MPPLSLLILHELFPSFPPLWGFLVAGLVVGGAITAIARRHERRRPADAAPGGEILGVPWWIPGYSLLFVLIGGLASLVVPFAGIAIMPGYAMMFIAAFRSSAFDRESLVIPALVIVLGSWIFWTLCAAAVWRISGALGWVPAKSGPARVIVDRSAR